LSASR